MNNRSLRFQRFRFGYGNEPISPIQIDQDEIHVWGFILDIDESELTQVSNWLSGDDQARADRLVSGQHRRRFLAAHAGVRLILSHYCRQSPQELVIQKTAAGKPFLRDSLSIRFNLTHSHDRALVAVAQTRDVGIDLEKVRPEVDVVSLAKRFLSSRDQTLIERGEPTRQHERFLQTWVAREAVYKAQGTGLTFPLNQDHVELTEDGTAGCLVQGSSNSNGESRPIRFLSLEPGWVGAVSAKGTDWTVSYRE